VSEDTKDYVKGKAKDAAVAVAKSEVGRNMTVGAVQGAKSANDKITSASVLLLLHASLVCYHRCVTILTPWTQDSLDAAAPNVGAARNARKDFKASAVDKVDNF
jgi:hypothetical protein